jgi:hypothetical protein
MDCRQIDVFRIPMRGPADISGLVALIERVPSAFAPNSP